MNQASLNETFALISIAGFAVQRLLELLDPLFVIVLFKFKDLRSTKDLPFGLADKDLKTWLAAFLAFLIGLFLAWSTNMQLLPFLEPAYGGWLDKLVIGLAISTGTNALNSVIKFGEHAKEARKKETTPMPSVTVTPASTTVTAGSSLQLLATVTGTDDEGVSWRVLEIGNGGSVHPTTGVYTAPTKTGTYHVAATSDANELAASVAVITVI